MFLSYATSHGHRMADAYCGLQKSIRSGQLSTAIYWAGQIGNNSNGVKGYPNALKKRLCQISLEDTASWEYASRLYRETKSDSKANFLELLPWVICLVQLPKTHSTAWLQRVAAQYVYEGGNIKKGTNFSVSTTTEIEFAASCLVAYHDDNQTFLRNACGEDGAIALAIYKYINNDPLVFHAWQMHQRRPEIRNRSITILPLSTSLSAEELESTLSTRLELPDQWYDKHTKKGKKLGRGYEHFFEIMVFNPRLYPLPEGEVPSARNGSEPYEQIAKNLYLDFRIDGAEVKSKQLLSTKPLSSISKFLDISEDGTCTLRLASAHQTLKRSADDPETENIEKPKKKVRTVTDNQFEHVVSSVTDEDIFDIDSNSRFLGFKNVTCLCKLKSPLLGLHELHPGDRIFFKMGESLENCQFALNCQKYKHELGMTNFYGQSIIEFVTLHKNYPLLVSEQHPNWSQSISRHFQSSVQKYSRASDTTSVPIMPVLITGVFDGIRLCDGMNHLTDGMKLLQILLFRKFLGISDTNATNIMINTSGDLYSVDENPAMEDKLVNYMTKGLITSQKFHTKLCTQAGDIILRQPREVGNFILKLQELNLGEEMLPHRLMEIHRSCPFDENTRDLLNNPIGKEKELMKLILKLKLQYSDFE